MYTLILFSFFIYATTFVAMQQIIGINNGASNIHRYQYPMFTVYLSVSLATITLGMMLMKDSSLTTMPLIRLIGVMVCLSGLYLSMRAQYDLGKNWVGGIGLHKSHKLITQGSYRFVRHPLYSGMILSAIGLCLITLNPVYGLGCLLFSGAYALRIPFEDNMLEGKYKRKYKDYKDTTGALFPTIRKRN